MISLTRSVGRAGRNHKGDVRKVESLLGRLGHLDLSKTDGPTGYFGVRLEDAVKSYQKDKGLKADGSINPGGETIAQLGNEGAVPKKPVPPKKPTVKKPIPPQVPGGSDDKTDNERNVKPSEMTEEERRKQDLKLFWLRMLRESLGR